MLHTADRGMRYGEGERDTEVCGDERMDRDGRDGDGGHKGGLVGDISLVGSRSFRAATGGLYQLHLSCIFCCKELQSLHPFVQSHCISSQPIPSHHIVPSWPCRGLAVHFVLAS